MSKNDRGFKHKRASIGRLKTKIHKRIEKLDRTFEEGRRDYLIKQINWMSNVIELRTNALKEQAERLKEKDYAEQVRREHLEATKEAQMQVSV